MSFFDPLRRTNVQVIVLAVVVGVQVSNVLSSIVSALSQAARVAFMPAYTPGIDMARALKTSFFLILSQSVFSAVIAAGTIWLLSRLLSQHNTEAE